MFWMLKNLQTLNGFVDAHFNVTTEHLARHAINNKDDVEIDKEPSFDEFIQIIMNLHQKSLRCKRMQRISNG
ncbi:hypothetical protein RIR_jg32827.t1 [Rhizophagus irregularis DAOM 181602=DAOM 197198]|nr:hypothetical protein RIR_jg32827.t1 [Rhizophagus irregularis DAOM 181602=DAOM 197198]